MEELYAICELNKDTPTLTGKDAGDLSVACHDHLRVREPRRGVRRDGAANPRRRGGRRIRIRAINGQQKEVTP